MVGTSENGDIFTLALDKAATDRNLDGRASVDCFFCCSWFIISKTIVVQKVTLVAHRYNLTAKRKNPPFSTDMLVQS